MEPEKVYRALDTREHGLTEGEVQQRIKTFGYNELPTQGFSLVKLLGRQFKNPIFAILIACAAVAFFFAEPEQSIVILTMICLSVLLGFYNEYRAEKIVEDLRQKVTMKAVVTREHKTTEISSRLLVPGDLVSLSIGDIVPADMRIVECKEMEADESSLTGESFPVEKSPIALILEHPTPQQLANYLFMGTVIMHGGGRGVVVSTGRNTEFGSISRSLVRPHPETEFQRGVKSYGTMLITLTLALAIGIFAINALLGHKIIDSLLFSLAVAIGLVPELMPAIVTISLSQGARRMGKVQVIAKRLLSIEDFGNMNVLCSDKTGTLTEGKITLRDYWSPHEEKDPRILHYGLLCNSALVGDRITGNAMDVAIWDYAIKNNAQNHLKIYQRIDEVPFDYQRRMMSTVVKKDDELVLIAKGAPESVLPRCIDAEKTGKKEPIGSVLKIIEGKLSELSRVGYRILAVAYRNPPLRASYSSNDEVDLTFLGFLVFVDPPKEDARRAIAKLRGMGVDVKILTGDNELVAEKICEELQVPFNRVVLGSDLTEMSSNEIKKTVEETSIFARITPEQKLDIIKALKSNGHVVGFMGDGVNDAPALYEADVGISVDTAADVSKDAADVVLLKKDLLTLANGIEEGRKIFGNTTKYILMGTSSNFGNMFSAAAASIFLPFLPMLPMQILFMNLLYDISNMTLPTDHVDDEDTRRPKHWDIGFIRKFTLFFGPFSSLYDFLTYGIMLFIFGASETLFQSGWFVESFWTEVLVIFVIRTRRIPFARSRPGKWLALLTISCVAFGTILPFTVLGGFLGFTQLPPEYWILLVLMVATYLLLVDAGKVFFYKVCKF
ncbi:MAG: magnesium-translocating P-type ATPase [Promethearchaeati archaeon SRVP18_Atabeyarchaeia-1]